MLPEYSHWTEFKSDWPYLLTLAPLAAQGGQARCLTADLTALGVSTFVSLLTLALLVVIRAQRRELEEVSITDKLTGLFNSRHLRAELDRQVAFAQRACAPLSMIFMDMDSFKSINDRYGHAVGDRMLRRFALSLLSAVRQHVDLCFRFGGDELLIPCPQTDAAEAAAIAERIARTPVELPEVCADKVTLSLSVTQMKERESPGEFLKRADQALYQAKRSRRSPMAFAR